MFSVVANVYVFDGVSGVVRKPELKLSTLREVEGEDYESWDAIKTYDQVTHL